MDRNRIHEMRDDELRRHLDEEWPAPKRPFADIKGPLDDEKVAPRSSRALLAIAIMVGLSLAVIALLVWKSVSG